MCKTFWNTHIQIIKWLIHKYVHWFFCDFHYNFTLLYLYHSCALYWGNPMTSKMLDWKIRPDLMLVKNNPIHRHRQSFGLFLHKWGGLDFQSKFFWVFALTFQCDSDKQSGEILSCARLDNLPEQVYYYAMLECAMFH